VSAGNLEGCVPLVHEKIEGVSQSGDCATLLYEGDFNENKLRKVSSRYAWTFGLYFGHFFQSPPFSNNDEIKSKKLCLRSGDILLLVSKVAKLETFLFV